MQILQGEAVTAAGDGVRAGEVSDFSPRQSLDAQTIPAARVDILAQRVQQDHRIGNVREPLAERITERDAERGDRTHAPIGGTLENGGGIAEFERRIKRREQAVRRERGDEACHRVRGKRGETAARAVLDEQRHMLARAIDVFRFGHQFGARLGVVVVHARQIEQAVLVEAAPDDVERAQYRRVVEQRGAVESVDALYQIGIILRREHCQVAAQ